MSSNYHKTKKQHYIPQMYLRHFSTDQERIYCFTKPTMNYRFQNIKDTAEENYFYDLGIEKCYNSFSTEQKEKLYEKYNIKYEDFDENKKIEIDQMLERFFSEQIEAPFSEILDNIIENKYNSNIDGEKNRYFISFEDKNEMSIYLAYQFVRTKSFRNLYNNFLINNKKKTMPIIAQFYGVKLDEEDINVFFDKEEMKFNHIGIILDDNFVKAIASVFSSHLWCLYVNNTTLSFATSDNPFALSRTNNVEGIFSGVGLALPSVAIKFPLTDKLLLVMYDKNVYPLVFDRRYKIINNVTDIINVNAEIVMNAYNYVYASNKELVDKILEICKKYPNYKRKI